MQHSHGQAGFPHGVEEEHGIGAARNSHANPPIPIMRYALNHV
jgi:hypothetical protein